MNSTLQNPYLKQAEQAIKRMRIFVLLVSLIGYSLYSFVLAPIYTQLSADTLYQDRILTILLYYIVPAMDVIVFYLVYPATIYALWRGGFRKAWGVPLTFVLMTLGKFVANYMMTCFTDGGFPSWNTFVQDDLVEIGIPLLLELLQYGFVVLFAVWLRGFTDPSDRAASFPIVKIFKFKPSAQLAAFLTAMVLLLGRVGMHAVYQWTLYMFNGSTDVLLLICFDLVGDILIATVAYFVMILLLSHFDKKDMEQLSSGNF